jgi:hypothetical protein
MLPKQMHVVFAHSRRRRRRAASFWWHFRIGLPWPDDSQTRNLLVSMPSLDAVARPERELVSNIARADNVGRGGRRIIATRRRESRSVMIGLGLRMSLVCSHGF